MTTAPPTWANTLNSTHRLHPGGMNAAWQAARELGYAYVAWNGWVYPANEGAVQTSVCRASDLDALTIGDGALRAFIAVCEATFAVVGLRDDTARMVTLAVEEAEKARAANRRTRGQKA